MWGIIENEKKKQEQNNNKKLNHEVFIKNELAVLFD